MLALWGIAESVSYWAFLVRPNITDFYPPIVWGGAWGLLLAFPSRMRLATRAVAVSFFPALTHLAIKNGWFLGGALSGFDIREFLTSYTLVYVAVYLVCWAGTCIVFLKRS